MYDVNELIARLVAIEQEASAALLIGQQVNAVPLWFYTQEGTPYWVNRTAQIGDDQQTAGDEGSIDSVTVEMGLIYGEVTAGFDGEVETTVNEILPGLVAFLRQRVRLQSTTYSNSMNYLYGCHISLTSNLTEFPPTPAGARRIGILFRASCQFYVPVEQDY